MSDAAVRLLIAMRAEAEADAIYLFPGDAPGKPLQDIKKFWQSVLREAGLENVRLHDLRHTFASHLASANLPLTVIGRLMGHTQAQTTHRYAHLQDAPLKAATTGFGEKIDRLIEGR